MVAVGAVIECSHGGQLKLTGGGNQLEAANAAVITLGLEAGLTFGSPTTPVPNMIKPCQAQTQTTPPAYVPCVTQPALPAGVSRTLFVVQRPALLETVTGTTLSGAGPGTWRVTDPGQSILEES